MSSHKEFTASALTPSLGSLGAVSQLKGLSCISNAVISLSWLGFVANGRTLRQRGRGKWMLYALDMILLLAMVLSSGGKHQIAYISLQNAARGDNPTCCFFQEVYSDLLALREYDCTAFLWLSPYAQWRYMYFGSRRIAALLFLGDLPHVTGFNLFDRFWNTNGPFRAYPGRSACSLESLVQKIL